MKRLNPKSHDSLFKWLIASFTKEFFAHYFPGVKLGQYRFLDKEFISKYEALTASLEGDLFLLLEAEIENEWREIAVQIEHQSDRKDVSERVFEYLCYVWLLKRKPVWSIVVYSDEAVWKQRVPEQFWYAFIPGMPKQFFQFSVIKIKDEKSSDLIHKHSLLCQLLALKANDDGTDPVELVSKIYRTVAQLKDQLTADQLLLITQWVDFYTKVSKQTLEQLKKEVNMEMIETTISEHIFNQGKAEGRAEGMLEGERKGELKGQLSILETLYRLGVLSADQMNSMTAPLRQQLAVL